MGIEAAKNALNTFAASKPPAAHPEGTGNINALYFASTSAPYTEKLGSATIASCIFQDAGGEEGTAGEGGALSIETIDMGNSTNSGVSSIVVCANKVDSSGGAGIVVASDAPLSVPDAPEEHGLGAGAAAFVLASDDYINKKQLRNIAEIRCSYSAVHELYGERFKKHDTPYIRDLKLASSVTVMSKVIHCAIAGLLDSVNLTAGDIAKVVYQQPDAVSVMRAITTLPKHKFSSEQLSKGIVSRTGDTGAASAPLNLAYELETASPGDLMMLVGYGAGASTAVLLETKNVVRGSEGGFKSLSYYLERVEYVNYVQYLQMKRLLSSTQGHIIR
jgi:3-hydroxy-3-methylglutaryl CoA synthase